MKKILGISIFVLLFLGVVRTVSAEKYKGFKYTPREKLKQFPKMENFDNFYSLIDISNINSSVAVYGTVMIDILIDKKGIPLTVVPGNTEGTVDQRLIDAVVDAALKYDGYIAGKKKRKAVNSWLESFVFVSNVPDSILNFSPVDEFIQHETEPSATNIYDLMRLVRYPKYEREKGIEGIVLVGVLIDTDGRAVQAKVIKSVTEGLDNAAKYAVLNYQNYIPATQDGKPVACWLMLPINFQIH